MAACVLFALSAVAGGGGWLVRDRLARQWDSETKAAETLKSMEPRLREDQPDDAALAAAVVRLQALLESGSLGPAVTRRTEQFLRDVRMLDELDQIRLRAAESTSGEMWSWPGAEKQYTSAFRDYGLDVEALTPDQAASRIRDSAIGEALLTGLDSWMQIVPVQGVGRERLRAVADRADESRWRQALRQAALADDKKKLQAIAGEVEILTQPPGVLDWLGSVLARAGLNQEAEAVFRQAQERHPEDFWVNYHLGHLLIFGPPPVRAEEAVGYFRAAVSIRPTSAEARSILGLALTRNGDLEGAIRALRQAIAVDAEFTPARVNLGDALRQKGQFDEAIAAYQEAVEIAPDIRDGRIHLADTLKDNGQCDEAIKEYRETLHRHKDFAEGRDSLVNVLKERAVAYNKSGQFGRALDDLSEALALNPKDWQAMDLQGWAHAGLGQWDKVLAVSNKAIEFNPLAWQPWNTRGGFYRITGQWNRAIADLSRAIELEPRAWCARCGRGLVYAMLKKNELALADYNKAIELEPNDPTVWQSRSWGLLEAGQYDSALADEKRAVEILRGRIEIDRQTVAANTRVDLGHGLWHMTRALSSATKYAEAETALREALQIFEDLTAEYPQERFYRQEAAVTLRLLADASRAASRASQAADSLRRATNLYASLVAEEPRSNFYRLEFASTYAQLGWLYRDTQSSTEAEAAFRKARDIAQKMLAETPLEPGVPAIFIDACRGLTDTLLELGRAQEAKELCLRVAQDYRSALVREKETFNAHRTSRGCWELAIALESFAQLTNELGETSEAERIYRDANAIWQKLVADSDSEDYRFHLGVDYDAIGAFLRQHARADEAEESYRTARAIWEKLVAEFNQEDRRKHLAWTNQALGELADAAGRPDDALVAYRHAAEVCEKLAEDFPSNSEYGGNYAHWLVVLANIYAKQGRDDEAEQVVTKGVGSPPPKDPRWLVLRGRALEAIGRVEQARNTFAEAFALAPDNLMIRIQALPDVNRPDAYAQALADLRAFLKEHPHQKAAVETLTKSMELRGGGNAFDWYFLAMAHGRLDELYEARKWYEQAVEWEEKNGQSLSGNPQLADELRRFRAEAEGVLESK